VKPSKRLDLIPPYLFAELERKIAAKKAAGIDVISLGIGDPDRPTPALIVEAMQEAITEPETHRYPSNRGRADFREAVSDFYMRRFDVEIDPATEVMPAIGAKECIFNLNLAFLDPGDAALSADPGYPVYTGGPLMAGADPVLMPLLPERQFAPDLGAISAADRARAKLMFFNYPNNPTGAVVRPGFFDEVVEFASANDILAVHDNAYSETVYDGYRAPSFLATPGAKDVRDLVVDALEKIGVDVTPPKGTIYIWAPVPDGFESAAAYCEHVLEEAAVVISPGGAYGPNGEGFFRISLTTPDDQLLEAVERLGRLAG
jgi:LL-diaminopimelate aminotransferase